VKWYRPSTCRFDRNAQAGGTAVSGFAAERLATAQMKVSAVDGTPDPWHEYRSINISSF